MADLSKDQELVAFFVQHCEGACGRTRLMKLLYLADYEARRALGRPISTLQYVWHHYGPYDDQMFKDLEGLKVAGVVVEEPLVLSNGKVTSLYSRGPTALQPSLSAVEMMVLTYVNREYSGARLRELLDDIVYQTEPMVDAKDRKRQGKQLKMDMVDGQGSRELGLSFEELMDRSRRVKAGEYLTHEQAMRQVAQVLAEADAVPA